MTAAAPAAPAFRRESWAGIGAILLVAVIALSVRPRRPTDAAVDVALPAFQGIDGVTGAPVSLDSLKGSPWVASFIFTRCQGPCPLIASRVAALQGRLSEGVKLVTFTVDPAYDAPDVLKEYAARFSAVPGRWLFVRLGPADLYRLSYEGFRLPIARNADGPEGFQVTHTARLVRVDAAGRVRGYYASGDAAELDRLEKDLRSAS